MNPTLQEMLRESILATIYYYDIFDFPLTLAEVYRYLINPKRLSGKQDNVFKAEANDIVSELDKMVRIEMVGHKNGFYFVPGRDELYEKRIEKDKVAAKKWKKFLTISRYLQMTPYLRALFASGSLAVNNTEEKSDFDVFVLIKSGRLYTGRFFLWIISSILRARRGRFDMVAPDKLCFNHYLADNNLELTHKSLYIAQSLNNMRPIIAYDNMLDDFSGANKWAHFYCYNFKSPSEYRRTRVSSMMISFSKFGEAILNNVVGDLMEKFLRNVQQKRIKNNPATYESGGRIVFNENELEFHPRSFERVVIDNYNNKLKKIGVLGIIEKDSGLKALP